MSGQKSETALIVAGVAGLGVLAWFIGQRIGGASAGPSYGAPLDLDPFKVGPAPSAGESWAQWYARQTASAEFGVKYPATPSAGGGVTWGNGQTTAPTGYGPTYGERYSYDLPASAPELPVAGTGGGFSVRGSYGRGQ